MGETARSRGFYKSEGEYGFKILYENALAILYIPKGAWVHIAAETTVYADPCDMEGRRFKPYVKPLCKHRASEARVVAIIDLTSAYYRLGITRIPAMCASSWSEVYRNHKFVYREGETVRPHMPFCSIDSACESGIHYYPTLDGLCRSGFIPTNYIYSLFYPRAFSTTHSELASIEMSNKMTDFIFVTIMHDIEEYNLYESTKTLRDYINYLLNPHVPFLP